MDAGHLYAMNFNDENMNEIEIKPEGIGSGENIVFVANQFWNASGSSDDKFNYLIVGTQSGDNYKLYFYNINGGAPDGKPLTGSDVRIVPSRTKGSSILPHT